MRFTLLLKVIRRRVVPLALATRRGGTFASDSRHGLISSSLLLLPLLPLLPLLSFL